MKNKKIIAICSSASFYKEVIEIEKRLKKMGYAVKIPKTAGKMKRNGNFDVTFYKTWYKNEKDYHKKTKLMNEHFRKIEKSDAILVVNYKKNNVDGYIGGNGLMEMLIAYLNKKRIFILNPVSAESLLYEEIMGLHPIFIHNDLSKIK